MKNNLLLLILLLSLLSCNRNTDIDTYQSTRNNIIDVNRYIHEIDMEDIYINNFSIPYVDEDYFIVCDMEAYEHPINIFNRNTYKHIVSIGEMGQGPGEITILGHVCWDKLQREIFVVDAGKYLVYAYNIDSVLVNPYYKPVEKFKLDPVSSPNEFYFINDTLSYCRAMIPTGDNSHTQSTGIWNMKTGDINLFEFNHPEIHKKRFFLAVSYEDSLYAECNYLYDMINIFDLKGNNIKNIYGPQWGETHLQCHSDATFTNDYLVTVYNGEQYERNEPSRKCLMFSKSGDYIVTLDIGYNIVRMCYDDLNDRLIFSFDDVIQFGYLNLKEIKL